MNLDVVQSFLEIYRRGSLTAAATARGISQPAVSGHLRRLEEHLGESLFQRTGQGVTPTARADRLAHRLGSHLDEVKAALRESDEEGWTGTVRIGAAAEITAARLVPGLSSLAGPGLQLRFTTGHPEALLPELVEGRLDLVVSSVRPRMPGVEAVPLIDEEFVLIAAPGIARRVDPELLSSSPLKALASLPLVAYSEELPIIRRYWRSEFGQRPGNPVALMVPDLRAVLAAVVAGVGVSVLPRYLAGPAVSVGQAEVLHEPVVAPLNTLHLARQGGVPPTPAASRVARRLRELASSWGDL